MSDRTYGSVRILACPPEQAQSVLSAMADYVGNHNTIVLGELYEDPEVSCGTASVLSNALAALDGVAYVVTEDPKFEWLGDIYARLPDGTTFDGTLGPEGDTVLTLGQWRSLRNTSDAELREKLDEALCLAGMDAQRALVDQLEAIPAKERTIVPTEEEA